ncbi:MAG TPA: DUF1549 domain-containing protein, partial [Roseimicrobium sp.]|nr:DUF1549 domain-containing protein [Roseimicrobium sp.]
MKTVRFGWMGVLTGAALGVVSTLAATAAEPTPAQVDFFEKKVRPILVDKCYSCHSEQSDKLKAGLLVDSREGLLKGGDNGPSIVPGDPDKSLFIKAIRYKDPDLQMPPKGAKLAAQEVKDLEEWVKMGAPDPRKSAGGVDKYKAAAKEAEKSHWAFKPVVKPEIPTVKIKGWVSSPIDAFVLQQMEEKAMLPSLSADKRTLLRRATYDLIGLPPSQKEVDDFMADKSPDAFTKVVDRLLASPRYGERSGRYWLDIARYSDTKGEVNRNREDPRYPYAWTYRDYVIKAFNDDKPYDKFLTEQLAADLIPGANTDSLAALGFITLGKRFMGNQNDVIDDRIDVVTKGTMALTVTCARCHDHKFDPVPTKDYYSLYGIFQSSVEPSVEPLLAKPVETQEYLDFTKQLTSVQDEVEAFREAKEEEIRSGLRAKVGDYLYAAAAAPKMPNDKRNVFVRQELKLDQGVLNAWQNTLRNIANGLARKQHNAIFIPWIEYSKLTDAEFATKGRELAAAAASNKIAPKPLNPMISRAFAGTPPANMKEVADKYARVLAEADKRWKSEMDGYEIRKKL